LAVLAGEQKGTRPRELDLTLERFERGSVRGTSATPVGVFESGKNTTAFATSICSFRIDASSLYTLSPLSVMMRMTFFRYWGSVEFDALLL